MPTPPRVPDEHYISEARRILDQPQPEVPEEIAAAAADAPEEESGNETEVEWGGSLTSYSSYEVCEIPDLETARKEAEAVAAQTKWLEQRRLQAPPLYAAGVAGSTARSSADSKGPAVEAELNKALDLCERIQGALSQSSQQPKPPSTTEVVDERPEEERDDRSTTGHRRDAAADGCSSESDASVEYRSSEPSAAERPAAAGKARAGPTPDRRHALLQQSLQQTANVGGAQGQVPPLQSAGTPAGSSKPVNHIDVLKSVKLPQSLKDRDQWERFSFQVETYLALLDENFPADLDNARKLTNFVDPVDMTDEAKSRGRQLFAMLNSWTQESAVASKIARGIRDQNGFEFWRLLWREMAPDNHSKSLVWRRSLLSPKFPAKEAEFSAALQEWEADRDKYEAEYGPSKATSDEDKRAVVLTEAPTALKQHLSIHIGTLSTYQSVREVVVSYLQAKQVWRPSAAYAGVTARTRDPDAMDISLVGDGKGKGKGKDGKGKDNKNGKGKEAKGKEAKGKGKDSHSNKGEGSLRHMLENRPYH